MATKQRLGTTSAIFDSMHEQLTSTSYLCGTTGHSCSSGDWRQAFANFLVQYVKYYAQEGITVTHLGFLNEPDFS